MLSLGLFLLKSGISQFSGILPKNERVLKILAKGGLQYWNSNKNEGLMKPRRPKESELVAAASLRSIAGCARQFLEARSWALSGAIPCTSTVHHFWDARVPVKLGTTGRPEFFSRHNQFCEGRLQFLVCVFRKTGLGDFSRLLLHTLASIQIELKVENFVL